MTKSFFYDDNKKLKPAQICVPLLGKDSKEITQHLSYIKKEKPDLIEWRVDYLNDSSIDNIQQCMALISSEVSGTIPLLFTWRSARDGGAEISDNIYKDVIKSAIESGFFDIVDIELSYDYTGVKELIAFAGLNGVETIISYHDFEKTLPIDDIINIFEQSRALGATAGKVAFMPDNSQDVINLMQANISFKSIYKNYPTVAISMGCEGKVTRIAAGFCGSAFTFATVGGSSAPGQLSVKDIRRCLDMLK